MRPIDVKPRLNALRQTLEEKNYDAMLVVDDTNVTYLSGFTNRDSFLFITGKNNGSANIFITDFRYIEQSMEECPDYEITLYRDNSPTLSKRLAGLCQKYEVSRMAFGQMHLTYKQYLYLKEDLVGVELCPSEGLSEGHRRFKDEAEAERLRFACAATDKTFADVCNFIRPGVTEREVEWALLSGFRKYGCDPGFPCIVVAGERGSLPHGIPGDRKVVNGEFITMDFGAMYQGYHADMTRTVFVGQPTAEQRRLYNIVLEANLRAESVLRAGVSTRAVDAAARDYITEMGYGDNFGHGLGHGVGLDIHERPFMNKFSEEIFAAGNFVTIEPGIYLPGNCGIRIEDTVLVKEDGCEVMFSAPKELICL